MDAVGGLVSELISGRVLELAAGTGLLSRILARNADSLVLVDSSPTSLAIARERMTTGSPSVTFVLADVFTWAGDGSTFGERCQRPRPHHFRRGGRRAGGLVDVAAPDRPT